MWWVGFATVTWTGESGPTWYETFESEEKRGFCPICGSRAVAIDSDIPEIGINVTALDDTSGTDLDPIHASFRDDAVRWLPRYRTPRTAPSIDTRETSGGQCLPALGPSSPGTVCGSPRRGDLLHRPVDDHGVFETSADQNPFRGLRGRRVDGVQREAGVLDGGSRLPPQGAEAGAPQARDPGDHQGERGVVAGEALVVLQGEGDPARSGRRAVPDRHEGA